MNEMTATPAAWATWRSHVSVDDANPDELEQLPDVFAHVRRDATILTQVRWAKEWQTRTFCDLALHLLYERHLRRGQRGRTDETPIFANIKASDLQRHALTGFLEFEEGSKLNVDRFTSTWGNQQAFYQDLLAYLFRPAPYMRRLDKLHPQLLELTHELTLGDWVRRTGKLEMDSILASPLVALHTSVVAARPQDFDVVDRVHRLRRLRLQRWADLYKQVFPAYGAPLRKDDMDWMEVAEKFSTVAGGAHMLAQSRPADGPSGVDGDQLGQLVVDLLPALFDINWGDVDSRRRID